MTNPLSRNIFLEGVCEPWRAESDIHDPIIIGKIPPELNGIFYRNGPNPQYVYSKNYHLYEGDGMIHAIRFNQGHVNYKNRWIRTERFLAERQARKSLFGGMRDMLVRDPSVKDISHNTANTNVIWHHGKLIALNEGSQPISVNPTDLIQCETYRFNNTLHRSMMAHPKIDPVTGELFFYSYLSSDLDFMYYIANKTGEIIHKEKIMMPYLSLMHDFAITENFSIFPVFPLTWDFRRLMAREPIFKWEPNLNTHFVIIPKYGTNQEAIWFEDSASLGMHVVNAYEENNKIILDIMIVDNIPDNTIAFADDSVTFASHLTRWIFDLKQRTMIKEKLDHSNMEFPRIDERFTGRKHQQAYMNCTVDKNLPHNLFDSIVAYDLKNHRKQIHHFGNDAVSLEPIFVPRTIHSPKGDGFLLSYVYRKSLNRSDLVILDAQHVDDEPIAIIQLPHRVPYGFHGCWVNQ